MIVLDTNVVSELMRPTPSSNVLAWIDQQLREELHITVISVAEILFGIERLPASRQKCHLAQRFAEMLSMRFPSRMLDFDYQSAISYATVAARRQRMGRPTEVPDAQIAAICREHQAVLAARNIKDFEESGVELINPWES